ncbi:MAG: PQQ-binding-like beta-propeller repeat protein, partial [Thermodesulfobacteriota bacterium]
FKGMELGDGGIIVMGDDGTLYATIQAPDELRRGAGGGKVVAIDSRDGKVKWEFKVKNAAMSPGLVIDKNGRIYYVSTGGNLYVLDRNGMLLKESLIIGKVKPGPGETRVYALLAISGGVLYVAGMDKVLYAIGKPLR